MAFTFSSISVIPFSSISCPSPLILFRRTSEFFSLTLYPAFSNLLMTSSSVFWCSSLFHRVTNIISSNHGAIFAWENVGISAGPQIIFWMYDIRSNFFRSVQNRIVCFSSLIVSSARLRSPNILFTIRSRLIASEIWYRLRRLLKKNEPWKWRPKQETNFNQTNRMLT